MWQYMSLACALLGLSVLLYHFTYRRKIKHQLNRINAILVELSHTEHSRQKIVLPPKEPLAEIGFLLNQLLADKNDEIYELRRIEQSQRTFLNHLAHDVRTPLTSLIGYLEAFERGYLEKEKLQEYLPLVLKKAEQLKTLTDQLFFWFKLEDGRKVFTDPALLETLDLNELTREIMIQWLPQFEHHGLQYHIEIGEEPLLVKMDQVAYTRIVENLLNNCLLHSQASLMSLSLNAEAEGIRLKITDDGIGISKKDMPFIFQKLYRCDPARAQTGSGLGLAITKELVRRFGGSITAISEGRGCVFEIYLPSNKHST